MEFTDTIVSSCLMMHKSYYYTYKFIYLHVWPTTIYQQSLITVNDEKDNVLMFDDDMTYGSMTGDM